MAEVPNIFNPKESENIKKVATSLGELDKILVPMLDKLVNAQKILKENAITFNNVKKAQDSVKKSSVELDKVATKLKNSEVALKEFEDKRTKTIIENRVETQKLAAATKQLINAKNAESGSTKQLNAVVSILNTRLSKVNQTTEIGKKKADTLRSALDKLNAKITAQGTAMTKLKRNIGNYGSALQGVGAKVKAFALQFAGALGLTSVIFLFVNGIKKAVASIVQFDAAMQNIAGITGTSRSELKEVEKTIKDVAGASIRTSNEVAKLAEVLFTLGKTKEEVVLMLKPVNDLSIGLETTSENAAELLGQTLNAFGKGAESAGEFADIIANMRTSTALNFERIKDALGFLAPTASALNLTLGDTGALIGILQDNGVKAARAGALLNTAFARLVGKGLTLDDALGKINNSTDKVKTSSELFGKRAFGLGLILAKNIDKVKKLGGEFDNLSSGSLKKLTDEQLKSISAQTKIASSAWQKWILNIDSGDGVISRVIRNTLKLFTALVTPVKTVTEKFDEQSKKVTDLEENIIPLLDRYDELKTKSELNKDEQEELNTVIKQVGLSLPTTITQWNKYGEAVDISTVAGRRSIEVWQRQNELLNADAITEQEKALSGYNDTIEDINFSLNKGTKTISVYMGQFAAPISDEVVLTAKEIEGLEKALNDVQLSKESTEKTIRGLKGIKEESTSTADSIVSDQKTILEAEEETSKAKLKREIKEEKQFQSAQDKLVAARARALKLIDDSNEEFSDNEEKRSETRREINLEGLKKGLSDEEKFAKKREKTNIESDEKSAAQQTEIAENLKNAKWDIAAQGVEALFTLNGFKFEKELNQLQVEKDARLANENLTQEERSAIEAEYTQRANEIKAKQAKSDKLNALFQVAINTAMGVTNALSKVVTAPLVPFIIAQGAIQAALIAAQPIPEYATGVVSTPERFIAGEKGRELMYKNNVAFMVNEPTLFDGKEFKGFGIKSNPETEKIISSGRRSEFVGKQMTDDRIVSKLDRLIKVSEKQKQPINNKGIETGYRFKNGKVNLINRYRYGN